MIRNIARTKVLFVLLLIFSAFLSAGCVDDQVSAEEIAEKMQQKNDLIEDSSFTLYMTMSLMGQESVMEQDMIQKKEKMRSVTKQPAEQAGTIVVSNGETMWTYDPRQNSVVIMEMPDLDLDQEINYAGLIAQFLNESDVSFSGMEKIEGRNTFIMNLEPKEEVPSAGPFTGNIKVWVDEETWMPLKYDIYDTDGNVIISVEVRNLQVNTGISDEVFEFEIPEGAEVSTLDMNEFALPEDITLEEAQEKADFDILHPSYIPEGYDFDHASLFDNSEFASGSQVLQRVTLVYINGDSQLHITEIFYEAGFPGPTEFPGSESVDVNGSPGDFVEVYGNKMLRWDVDDIELVITASLDKDELLEIAGSMN
ncbi:outer membrane lipoprotein-sorting protein [Methanococcoides orientis]|uniref:outer membrane lipoprotein-sorting protein n=1 Tax=Methanococcoides orientis TaxID=2822137 RepID=UPI001E5A7963|nr:outer membrane lipoprotein-sorting protein [Methanococcoides orientis]UGV40265.1 outer membrane lipoprotein-sorting protein [Methanococcoides orientis]